MVGRDEKITEQLISSMRKLGYKVFENGYKDYNLNIVAVRRAVDTNLFDDSLYVFWKHNGKWVIKEYIITTDAGRHYLMNPMSNLGTAIVSEGQYVGAYAIDKHLGKYEALCQIKPIKVYRDRDKDTKHDFEPESLHSGVFGINIHKSGINSIYVDNWSAGCFVFKTSDAFDEFMDICRHARDIHGNRFTMTLLNESQIK